MARAWLFRVVPIIDAVLGAVLYRCIGCEKRA